MSYAHNQCIDVNERDRDDDDDDDLNTVKGSFCLYTFLVLLD